MLLAALVAISLQGVQASDFVTEPDVTFATTAGHALALDLVRPAGDGPFPAILCLHGGGWRQGHRHEMLGVVQDWARAGYVAATASYRLVPHATWPAQLDDALAALAFLRRHAARFRLDPERIAATGFSAGGHLALMLGLDEVRTASAGGPVRAVVNYFGPTDLRGIGQVRGAGSVRALAGAGADASTFADLSPATFATPGDAPVVTLQGRDDRIVPPSQATGLHALLRQAGIPEHVELLDGLGHGWRGADLQRTQTTARAFAERYLRGGGLPLLACEDFDGGAARWELIAPDAWVVRREPRTCLALHAASDYEPAVRSPRALALLRGLSVTEFVLDVDVRSTTAEYPHRDLCLVFGYESPTRYYYAHLASKPDDRAHGVFLVDGADRRNVTATRDGGVRWRNGWHRVRVQRDAAGDVVVFTDDFSRPALTATDRTLPGGRVGFGSFDDQGEFDVVRLYGKRSDG